MLSYAAVNLVVLVSLAGHGEWSEVSQEDNVTLWQRNIAGSEYSEYRAQILVNAPSRKVWKVLLDVDSYPEFMPLIEEVRVLSGKDSNTVYVYQRLDPPLIDSRDTSLRVELSSFDSLGRYEMDFSTANDRGPAPGDAVRMKRFDGSWEIDRLGPNQTLVTYHIHAEPGGMVSRWMADRAYQQSVPELMLAVQSRTLNPSWQR